MSAADRKRKKVKFFTSDVKSLLYAFGDVENPLPETVNALEDILITYIIDTCHEASAFAKTTKRQKIKVDDFKFVLRRDPVKHGRVQELLNLQKIIQDARKQFDNSEGKSLKNANYVAEDDDDDEKGSDKDDGDDKEELDLGDLTTTSVNTTTNGIPSSSQISNDTSLISTTTKKGKKNDKTAEQDPKKKPKRKYNKDPNKERKPYKKRAKKGEQPNVATPK
ncbi:hypothetical protein BN7_1494 [Wickerhamomyces ciferrii]|uniref:Transcription initiation factor TFIID subunit 13 n=1 Tax=Wickerhamomyces ciferrii (strain ATCC 14091 / BCRC 22168 / CBS 111 / JCM 3599 / NBRC 0793 / NRRL Y-1031 F-60-10) TaxID=1206466 RepID=K0KAF9_WICCF|nr:uncharacterized protein BN7_1494 [Wickerhamomyces ciferrii]CCH41955.1 hypothetical protein BN7_1494 [Wickerhamomyces ciferrii]